MVKIKRKHKKVSEKKTNVVDFRDPKFYIVNVGGEYSITHRLTHTFMECVGTLEELVERVRYWINMSEEELWNFLLYKRYVKVPKNNLDVKGYDKENEEWYQKAWCTFTQKFYKDHPELYIEDKEFPLELISKIRRERMVRDREEYKRDLETRKEIEKRLNEEEKKKSTKEDIEESESIFKDTKELKKKIKKVKKKVKVKLKSKKSVSIIDSDDLFA